MKLRALSVPANMMGGIQSIGAIIGIGPGRLLTKGLEKGAEKIVQTQVERAAVKALEEKAAKEAAEAAAKKKAADEAAAAATVTGKAGAIVTRKLSLRLKYLGKTPGKNSRTGREVRERMREEGRLRTNRRGQDEFLDENNVWRPVDSPQTHMGHYPTDAVDYWNNEGRFYGAKSQEVRDWMLDSKNCRFEWGPSNSARGGQTTSRNLPPAR